MPIRLNGTALSIISRILEINVAALLGFLFSASLGSPLVSLQNLHFCHGPARNAPSVRAKQESAPAAYACK
jgi:hypothetical protein